MFLTKMELDITKRHTMKALESPNLIHGAVESAFQGERERNLWRIDRLGGRYYLLLLSNQKPSLQHAISQFGLEGESWQTKSYQPLLERIEENTIWRFRLTANPTKSCKESSQNRGIVRAHITTHYQEQWLAERCESCGFSLQPQEFSVVESRWLKFYKGANRKKPVSLLAVTYEGILTVTDKERFQATLQKGIGRGKAYGMGMLTVARIGGM